MITVVTGENLQAMEDLADKLAKESGLQRFHSLPVCELPRYEQLAWTTDLVATYKGDTSIVIVTYSELVFRRLQRLVAEEALPVTSLAAYFVNAKGESTELAFDEFGRVSNWPENMFGYSITETGAQMRAMIKRLTVREDLGRKNEGND